MERKKFDQSQNFKTLKFKPLLGLSSKHLQMIISTYIPAGKAPPSKNWLVNLGEEDRLCCSVSTPDSWNKNDKTVVLIHGLGGSEQSRYMVRMARKLYERGERAVRINLRGCGSGKGLSKRPYCAGNSSDILHVLKNLKEESPDSDLYLIGFSLGGNIALKLAGELSESGENLIKTVIAVCPPFDLKQTMLSIQQKKNFLYHGYYLKQMLHQAGAWVAKKVQSIYEFDNHVTAPLWGFSGANDYYEKCSCVQFLNQITIPSHLICAEDDPFISLDHLKNASISSKVNLWKTRYGSHMGFLGRTRDSWSFQWMDQLLLDFIDG